jgi:hypothetical protein
VTEETTFSALVAAMTSWADITVDDRRRLALVAADVEPFARFGEAQYLDGLERFLGSHREDGLGVSDMGKLFVINRFVFAVPPRAPLDRPRFASFVGIPQHDGWVDELWPWEQDDSGRLSLTGVFRGYVGETYQALEEAQFFLTEYGFRSAGAVPGQSFVDE